MNKIFNTKQECVYSILNSEKHNIAEISRATGISRSQLTKWKSGADVSVRMDSVYKLVQHLGLDVEFQSDQIIINNAEDKKNQFNKGGNMENEILYEHINLLREKVAAQTKKINLLEEKNSINEIGNKSLNVIYEDLQPHFTSTVRVRNLLSLAKMERRIETISNSDMLAKALNTSNSKLNEFYDVGVWHKFNEHPVNAIIMPDSLAELQTVSKTIPTLSSTYKFTFGAIYYKFTIIYFYKKNICITSSWVKINWGTQPYIETKNIIHDQNLKH
jgi:transcriptional regulator with XRE-family HTH domain